jgi:hypothetical protein
MITTDDFDCLSIEIARDRLAVWVDDMMRQVTLPDAQRDVAELVGLLIETEARAHTNQMIGSPRQRH